MKRLAQTCWVNPEDLPPEGVLFGNTRGMHVVREQLDAILSGHQLVLIQGESGTGRKTMAQFLHSRSRQSSSPLVKFNCAAIPSSLLATELMALAPRDPEHTQEVTCGYSRHAAWGTILLEDAECIDGEFQQKIGQMMSELCEAHYTRESGEILPWRVICTSIPLGRSVASTGASSDPKLLEGVDAISLQILALRDRREDIPELCDFWMERLARRYGKRKLRISQDLLLRLMQWHWPGNLPELCNWIARFLILGVEELPSDAPKHGLPEHRWTRPSWTTSVVEGRHLFLDDPAIPNDMIQSALQKHGERRRRVAVQPRTNSPTSLEKANGSECPCRRRGHRVRCPRT